MTKSSYEYIVDRRADLASVLAHPIRRQIRDLLRNNEALTLTEISRKLKRSEPLIYHHLNEMLKAGVIVKEETKISGRRVALYCLSDEYEELFGDIKPDITPIIMLSGIYGILTLLSLTLPKYMIKIYSILHIYDISAMIDINLVGFITTLLILSCYEFQYSDRIKALIIKYKFYILSLIKRIRSSTQ